MTITYLTSDWLILNWRASGGKTLHGVLSCVLLFTVNMMVNSVYLLVFCLFCVFYNVSDKISTVILMRIG